MLFTLEEIIKITHGKLLQEKRLKKKQTLRVRAISTDSRTLKKGDLFVALIGPHFDGHIFLPQAARKGACAAIVATRNLPSLPADFPLILVTDTLRALHRLARAHREKFNIPVIGITGSMGKTTTKDMLASILSERGKTLKNFENYNNEIGVPLTLFQLNKRHRFAVMEMATQKPGDMEILAKMVQPTLCVITNIGMSHIAFFQSKQAIAEEKSQIFAANPPGNVLLNADDPFFPSLAKKAQQKKWKVLSFGMRKSADMHATQIWHQGFRAIFSVGKEAYTLPIPGAHNVYNALPGVAIGKLFHLSAKVIQKGLTTFRPSRNRMKILRSAKGFRILNDTYNANPDAMKAALLTLHHVSNGKGRKIAVLGDMLELGHLEKAGHQAVGEFLAHYPIDILITTGKRAKAIGAVVKQHPLATQVYHQSQETLPIFLKKLLMPNDFVLLKASRPLQLDQIIPHILG